MDATTYIKLTREEYAWMEVAKDLLTDANRRYKTPTEARLQWERLADSGPIVLDKLFQIIHDRMPVADSFPELAPEKQAADWLNTLLNHPSGTQLERRVYLETAERYLKDALTRLNEQEDVAA